MLSRCSSRGHRQQKGDPKNQNKPVNPLRKLRIDNYSVLLSGRGDSVYINSKLAMRATLFSSTYFAPLNGMALHIILLYYDAWQLNAYYFRSNLDKF
jgi:hypothetical protein